MAFLAGRAWRGLSTEYANGLDLDFESLRITFSKNTENTLEIALLRTEWRPRMDALRKIWRRRSGGRAAPLLVIALYDSDAKATVCGPRELAGSNKLPVYRDMDSDRAERICRAALEKPDRHAAIELLQEILPEAQDRILGIINRGLLATHQLEHGVTERDDWNEAVQRGRSLRQRRKRELLRNLGWQISLVGQVSVLKADGEGRALALILNRNETPGLPSLRFSNLSPIAYALARADDEGLPYVVMAADDALRREEFYTDPANVQPRVSGLLRRVAQHLRTHPPRHIAPERLHDILNSVETRLPRWQEQEIRETFNAERDDVYAVSAAIVEKAQELGLQPPAPASPLPVIDRDEIHLIVWMAVDDD